MTFEEDICVAAEGIEVFLLQVQPGTEDPIMQRLLERGAELVAKGIGKYDIVAVKTFSDEPQGLSILDGEALKALIDYDHNVCFAWETPAPTASRSSNHPIRDTINLASTKPAWGAVTLVKLNPHVIIGDGIPSPIQRQYERVTQIRESLEQDLAGCIVLGSLGWFDAILVLWDQDLTRITTALTHIGGLVTTTNQPTCLKTFTTLTVHSDYVLGRRPWTELPDPDPNQIVADISIACRTENLESVRRAATELLSLDRTAAVFGTDDLAGRSSLSISQYLSNLMDFRHKFREQIFSTLTRIGSLVPSRLSEYTTPVPVYEEELGALLADPAALSVFPGDEEPPELALSDTIEMYRSFGRVYHAALSSEMVRDAYCDMLPSIVSLIENRHRLELVPVSLREHVTYLNAGYQQRCLDTMVAAWTFFSNPYPLYTSSGFQKVLWAAEHLVAETLSVLGVEWRGFIVYGLSNDFVTNELDIINIPLRYFTKIEGWWGVIHEAGHVYVRAKSELPAFLRFVELSLTAYREDDFSDQIGEDYFLSVLTEELADVFDYKYGFMNDWTKYRDTFFGYVLDYFVKGYLRESIARGSGLSERSVAGHSVLHYLARLVGVYMFAKSVVEDEFEAAVDRFLGEIRSALAQHVEEIIYDPQFGLSSEERIAASEDWSALLNTDKVIVEFSKTGLYGLFFRPVGQELLGSLFSIDVSVGVLNSAESTRLGKVELQPRGARAMLQSLRDRGAPSWHERVAVILSFWNAYAIHQPSRLAAVGSALRQAGR